MGHFTFINQKLLDFSDHEFDCKNRIDPHLSTVSVKLFKSFMILSLKDYTMPILVFIREIDPNTYLHFAYAGKGTCLRDYSRGPLAPPTEIRGYSKNQIMELLKVPGNCSEKAPKNHKHVSDHFFWHQFIYNLNGKYGLPGNKGPGQFSRLLDQFHAEVAHSISNENKSKLIDRLQIWKEKFAAIVNKKVGFTLKEENNTSSSQPITSGRGWTSRMLEFSLGEKEFCRIKTGDPILDFSLLSIEPNMSISSKNNPIIPGSKSSINLDGLGIRSDGTFCVLEVKAEKDCHELFRATIQALCGAFTLIAKKDMIVELTRQANGKRLAVSTISLSDNKPSLGLYVMVDSKKYQFPEYEEFKNSIQLLMEAFKPLKEVAFFSVDPRSQEFPGKIPVTHVIRRHSSP